MKTSVQSPILALASLVGALVGPVAAQCDLDEHFPTVPAGHGSFGIAVDLWLNRVAVLSSELPPSVHILERAPGGWVERAVIQRPWIDDIALWGDTLLVGDHTDGEAGSGAGAVFVYQRQGGTWTNVHKLMPTGGLTNTSFGESIDLEGDTAVVGARSAGMAFVFERTAGAWSAPEVLYDRTVGPGYEFGWDVAVSGDRIVVGMPFFSSGYAEPDGAACLFERVGGTWRQIDRIDGYGGDNAGVGAEVAIEDDLIALGAPGGGGPLQPGRVFLFRRVGSLSALLGVLEAQHGRQFGWSTLRFADGALVAGHHRDDEHGHWSGAVLVFRHTGGHEWMSSRITLPHPRADDNFGRNLAVWRDTVVAGAYGRDTLRPDGGSFATFSLAACGPDVAVYCPPNPNSTGFGAELSASGHVSLDDPSIVLRIAHAPPNEHGVYFLGPETQDVPFGDGRLCVAPGGTGYLRVPAIEQIGLDGRALHELDFGSPPLDPPSGHLLPGTTWNFQFWFRDSSSAGAGFNLSNALRIGFTH